MIVVSDASPLISLAAIQQLDLLRLLYRTVLVPAAVDREITAGDSSLPDITELRAASWIRVQMVQNHLLVQALSLSLDPGEAEAIALAVEAKADLLLMDERRGRAAGTRLGQHVVGVLGVLMEAKQRGYLSAVRPVLETLTSKAGFRVSEALKERVLAAAGE